MKRCTHEPWSKGTKDREVCHCNKCGRTVIRNKVTIGGSFGKPIIERTGYDTMDYKRRLNRETKGSIKPA